MNPTAANDTGIVGDQNTMVSEPQFIGQLFAAFPNTVANLPVYIEFGALHNGVITLAPGLGGRGYTGTFDYQVTTNSVGTFTVTPTTPLPEGFQSAEAVVVGQPDCAATPWLFEWLPRQLPHRQDGACDHGSLIHVRRPLRPAFAG